MVFRAFTFVMVFIVYVNANPAPANPKFTLVKDSSFGFGAAAAGGTTSGAVVEKDRSFEAPFPGDTGDNVPDVTLIDNVNTGAGFAVAGGITTGVSKNAFFSKQN